MKTKFVVKMLGCLLVFAIGCGTPAAIQHHALAGDPCDPENGQCGEGLVCSSTETCGVPCGNGNVVCESTTVCTAAHDCVPPCMVNGAPVFRAPGTNSCEGRGLITADDGRCVVPCWYEICDVLGGTCG